MLKFLPYMKHAIANHLVKQPKYRTGIAAFNEDETELIEYYHSIVEASKETGISVNTLYTTVYNKNRNPVHGRVWLKEGRNIRLTTSENKVDKKESTGNE